MDFLASQAAYSFYLPKHFSSYMAEKFQVQSFFAALKALSRKEVHYGAYATSEQVVWISSWCTE